VTTTKSAQAPRLDVSVTFRANLPRFTRNDVLITSYGGAGQALLGNILCELGLNYADAYTEILEPDGSTSPAGFEPYRRRVATLDARDAADEPARPVRLWPRFNKHHHFVQVFDGYVFGGIWFLVRDPRDALYSWYRWRLDFAEESFDEVPESFEEFLRGPDHTGRSPIEDWTSFYVDWMEQQRVRDDRDPLVTRFEDLKERPFPAMREALAAFGLEVEDDALRRAIERSTFDSMRKHEESVAEADEDRAPEARIMRSGKVSGWKEWMTPEIERHFSGPEIRSVAQRFGYSLRA
jgi:Sulfotransferase domain